MADSKENYERDLGSYRVNRLALIVMLRDDFLVSFSLYNQFIVQETIDKNEMTYPLPR